jgi:hypothetical protein
MRRAVAEIQFGESMNLGVYLLSRGLPQEAVDELLPYIPEEGQESAFCDAASIMHPERWFYWPGQARFVPVGQCPNGDAVAIDTQKEPGAVFYVAHELLAGTRPLEEIVIRVADSPSDYVQKLRKDDFPFDYWEARTRSTEPTASPNRRPARRRAVRAPRRGGGR